MATILLAAELGRGLGHVSRLLTVGGRLPAGGHRLVLAAPNLAETWPLWRAGDIQVLQSPRLDGAVTAPQTGGQAASYADILRAARYDDEDALAARVHAWRSIIEVTGAELIVADHAPAACLAAAGCVPAVVVGTGFTVPPVEGDRFPPLRASQNEAGDDEPVRRAVGRVQGLMRQAVSPTLPHAFAGTVRHACCSRELDPYRAVRRGAPAGALNATIGPQTPGREPRVFAYLAPGPHLEVLVTGLLRSRVRGALYVRGAPPFLEGLLAGSRVQLHATPAAASDVLPAATVILHHGGSLSEAALAAGRPQLLAPLHLEQELTARALVDLGVGASIEPSSSPDEVAACVVRWANDGPAAARAHAVAIRVASDRPPDPVAVIVRGCQQLLDAEREGR